MTSNDVNLSIKLWLDVGNNEYIILCYFGVRIMSGLEVIEGGGGGGGHLDLPEVDLTRVSKRTERAF